MTAELSPIDIGLVFVTACGVVALAAAVALWKAAR